METEDEPAHWPNLFSSSEFSTSVQIQSQTSYINPLRLGVAFLYLLKTSENLNL